MESTYKSPTATYQFQKQHVKATIDTSLFKTNINKIQLKNGALYIQNLIMPVKRFGKEFLNKPLNAAGIRRYSVFNLESFTL